MPADPREEFLPRTTVLSMGVAGQSVRRMQELLRAGGFHGFEVNNTFDEATKAAVEAYQIDHGLRADGVAGEITLAEMGLVLPSALVWQLLHEHRRIGVLEMRIRDGDEVVGGLRDQVEQQAEQITRLEAHGASHASKGMVAATSGMAFLAGLVGASIIWALAVT